MNKLLLILSVIVATSVAYADENPQSACKQHHELMKSIPHTKITYKTYSEFTTYENKTHKGCSVLVETKWSLVGENFSQSSVLDLPGWINGNFIADGPGSSIYERVKGNLFSMVGYSFSSYVNEETNQLVTGDNLRMYAECAVNQ